MRRISPKSKSPNFNIFARLINTFGLQFEDFPREMFGLLWGILDAIDDDDDLF